jgi:hypothetical protein
VNVLRTDMAWTAVAMVLVEAMRLSALHLPRGRRAAGYFRVATVLLAATIAFGVLETLLAVLGTPRAIRIAVLAGDIAVELFAIGCALVGTAFLVAGLRPPRPPRRRHVSRGAATGAAQPVVV